MEGRRKPSHSGRNRKEIILKMAAEKELRTLETVAHTLERGLRQKKSPVGLPSPVTFQFAEALLELGKAQ
jgi:hypothetical protein